MVYLNEEQLLSCTVGQLTHDLSGDCGVTYDELEIFADYFRKNLGNDNALVSFPDGRITCYNDRWRKHFDYFMGKFVFQPEEIIFKSSIDTVITNIELLLAELNRKGFNEDEAKKIIETSISEFRQTYSDLHGDDFVSQKSYVSLLKSKDNKK